MSTADEMHHVQVELSAVLKDMRGLNPRTSTYQKLAARRDALQVKLSNMGARRAKRS